MLVAFILACVLALAPVGSASATTGCVLDVLGIKVCGKLLTPLPTVTVTLPPVHTTVTVRVPGPTVTKTVRLPGSTVTKTVTVNQPGQVPPPVTKTVNAGPTQGPDRQTTVTKTATQSVTVSPSGQPTHTHGTIAPSNTPVPHLPLFNFGNTPTVVKAGIGLLSLIFILACILLGMLYAFRLGYNAKGKEDTNFLREVLDSAKVGRGKHS